MLVKLLFFSLILSPNNHEEMLIMPGKATPHCRSSIPNSIKFLFEIVIMIVIVFLNIFYIKMH